MMYARVARAQVDPTRVDEFVKRWDDHVLSVAKQQAGFHHAYGLYDPSTHEAMSTMFFDSKEDLDKAMTVIQGTTSVISGLAAGPASFHVYEVRVEG